MTLLARRVPLLGGLLLAALLSGPAGAAPTVTVEYTPVFANSRHPSVCYWFFTADLLEGDRALATLDLLATQGPWDLVFLTARGGVNFHDTARMAPHFRRLVAHAHQRGLKIGLQLWDSKAPVALEDAESAIVEGEVTLDRDGRAVYQGVARNIRQNMSPLLRSELFRTYAFRRIADGIYDPATLEDITDRCRATKPDQATVGVEIDAGPERAGRTVRVLTAHTYNQASNHGAAAAARLVTTLQAYADIPFDGVALDEYTNLRITPPWEMEKAGALFRERLYSRAMDACFQETTGRDLGRSLFDMRYAPAGQPGARIRAINEYMDVMRHGTLHVERAVHAAAKSLFGPATFIGVHNTHHNALDQDEIWVTGLTWWSLPRDYGQTDEHSPLPTQMGVAMAAPGRVLYNMYYDRELGRLTAKALGDLRFGIRTHYHAINDVQGWGVRLETPAALAAIGAVERCARLLNRFDPALPDVRLLVVFGPEALANWLPNEADRGRYDVNANLRIEEKAAALWSAGYRNALVSSDLIVEGKLTVGTDGRAELQGHRFDAVVWVAPQYAREPVWKFFEHYVARGGRLLIDGAATHDFRGDEVGARFRQLVRSARAGELNPENAARLGVAPAPDGSGSRNEDGSWTFTDHASLLGGPPARFAVRVGADEYTGTYRGLAAFRGDPRAGPWALAAVGLEELRRNGTPWLRLSAPADVFLTGAEANMHVLIADPTRAIQASWPVPPE